MITFLYSFELGIHPIMRDVRLDIHASTWCSKGHFNKKLIARCWSSTAYCPELRKPNLDIHKYFGCCIYECRVAFVRPDCYLSIQYQLSFRTSNHNPVMWHPLVQTAIFRFDVGHCPRRQTVIRSICRVTILDLDLMLPPTPVIGIWFSPGPVIDQEFSRQFFMQYFGTSYQSTVSTVKCVAAIKSL